MACDASEQSKLTTNELVGAAFAEAGYTCKGYHEARDYAGTPFSTGRSDDCGPMISGGASSVCNDNANGGHKALCYCWKAVGQWILGANGETCDTVCGREGKSC